MYLKIKKFGKVKSFEAKVEGLTLIMGENNTGKSTVGKIIFSIFKSLNGYEEFDRADKLRTVKRAFDFFLADVAKVIKRQSNYFIENKQKIKESTDFNEINESLLFLKKYPNIHNNEELISKLDKIIHNLIILPHPANYAAKCFDDVFNHKIINSVEADAYPAQVELSLRPDSSTLFSYEATSPSRTTSSAASFTERLKDLMDDSLFVESPFVVDLSNMLTISDYTKAIDDFASREKHLSEVSAISVDLIKKLKSTKPSSYNDDVIGNINSIINGDFFFDEKSGLFKFKLNNGTDLTSHNMPSGVKSFGIIKMLLDRDKINKKTILVLDEPENCLHPQWQAKYAELIINLIKEKDANIIINTHSPYMIQAIKSFAIKKGIWQDKDKIRYIWAENEDNSNWATFKELDLSKEEELSIFDKLGKVMLELI